MSDLGWMINFDLWNLFIDTSLYISSENTDFGIHSIQKSTFLKNVQFKCIRGNKFDLDIK